MSALSGIPDDVHRLIDEHIGSVEQLEILLLLRARRDRDWNGAEVAAELRIAALSAGNRLVDLAARGFAVANGDRYRYAPAPPELETAVDGLAKLYPERRVTVIQLIFAKPSEPIRTFADAFKLRRDK